MTFCAHSIVSTLGSVNSGLCSLLVLLAPVYLGVCPSGTLCSLILSTRKSFHIANFSLRIVFTAASAQSEFYTLEFVHLGPCLV